MAIGNPRIHIICGICGCNKLLSFYIKNKKVTIVCNNCNSITDLDELIKKVK